MPGPDEYIKYVKKVYIKNGKVYDVLGKVGKNELETGIADCNFVYEQINASDEWIIQHNLNKYPAVSVVDSLGNNVFGKVEYINQNLIRIKFKYSFAGKAFLN